MGMVLPAPADPRVAHLLATAAMLHRSAIEQAVDAFIALLDARDPDADEEAVTWPDHGPHVLTAAAISDDHEPDGDAMGDVAWQEWGSRDPRHRRRALHEPTGAARTSEDDEEDDDDTACDDGPIDGETDSEPGSWVEGDEYRTGGLHTYADDDFEEEAGQARERRGHRDRARARCDSWVRWGERGWRVPHRPTPASFGRRA